MSLKFVSTTFVVYINRFFKKNIPLLLIILLAIALRIYKINYAFPFDYDQEVPALAAYDFFINHKITFIGQELSFKGFFLGPLHNWIQFIPYGPCNLKPDCVPYFYLAISIVTLGLFYKIIKRIFGNKTALISSGIIAISFAQISHEAATNSAYFLFLISIGLLFTLYKYFLGQNNYLILGALFAGIAVVNFNPVFIFSALAFFITAFIRKGREIKIVFLAVIAFFINYIPLVIFNFRHQNILWHNFQNFIIQNSENTNYIEKFIFIIKNIFLPYLSNYLFQSANVFFIIFTSILIFYGFYNLKNSKRKVINSINKNRFVYYLPIWIIIPILGFTFYKGHIPDYYFLQTLFPIIILITVSLRKNIAIFLIFFSAFAFLNIKSVVNYDTVINYKVKKDAVNYVLYDSKGETFNVYYQIPLALNTGYPFLFKVFGRLPQEGGRNLYILEFTDPVQFAQDKYFKSFPDKKIDVKVIGFIHVVSIK